MEKACALLRISGSFWRPAYKSVSCRQRETKADFVFVGPSGQSFRGGDDKLINIQTADAIFPGPGLRKGFGCGARRTEADLGSRDRQTLRGWA